MTRYTGVTLFSGGGILQAGLTDLVRFVGAVEADEPVAAHYATVYGGDGLICGDVCGVDFSRWAGVDWLHASPPCPAFSVANSAKGERPEDRRMGAAVERAIVVIDPKVLTLENVQGYAGSDSFAGICEVLRERGYCYDVQILNSADWSVPQTRRRLILRAWKRTRGLLPLVLGTHAERGKMASGKRTTSLFDESPLLPWVGWCEALTDPRYGEDLIPTLPKSRLADWQKKRLSGDVLESLLCGVNGENTDAFTAEEPAPGIAANHAAAKYRAVLVDGQGTMDDAGTPTCRGADEPMQTVTASHWKGMPRAVLVGPDTACEGTALTCRKPDEPAHTIKTGNGGGGGIYRAVLVDGDNAGKCGPIARPATVPSGTVAAGAHAASCRAILDTADVRSMTPRALARFMMGVYSDAYPLPAKASLATRILGNGACSELFRALMVPLLERIG